MSVRSSTQAARGARAAAACRWGSGNAHRHLPAVSWELPQPWLHGCPLPGTSATPLTPPSPGTLLAVPSGWQSRAHGPTATGCPLPEQPVPALRWQMSLQATFSSSSPSSASEKEVFISRGFAFNSQGNKISFKSIKKAPRKHCVMKDASSQLFSVEGKEKTA